MTAQIDCHSSNGDLWIESQNTMLLLDTKDLDTLSRLLDKITPLRPFINKVNEWKAEL